MTAEERHAKRTLRKEQRDLAAFHQGRLATLEAVRTQGLTLFSIAPPLREEKEPGLLS